MTRSFFTGLALIILALAGLTTAASDPYPPVKAKYKPWYRIYLSYTTLADLKNTFMESNRAVALNRFGDPVAAGKLRRFVTDHVQGSANDSAALLELDLEHERAGYMQSSAVDGSLTDLPSWSQSDVRKIAVMIDQYLSSNSAAISFATNLGFDPEIHGSWIQLSRIVNDPFVSPRASWAAKSAFLSYLDRKPESLSSVQATDPELAKNIETFRTAARGLWEQPPVYRSIDGTTQWDYAQSMTDTRSTTAALTSAWTTTDWTTAMTDTARSTTSGTSTTGTTTTRTTTIEITATGTYR